MSEAPADIWAVALCARKGDELSLSASRVRAASYDEATGKAWRLALRFYPPGAGYHCHGAAASMPGCLIENVDAATMATDDEAAAIIAGARKDRETL